MKHVGSKHQLGVDISVFVIALGQLGFHGVTPACVTPISRCVIITFGRHLVSSGLLTQVGNNLRNFRHIQTCSRVDILLAMTLILQAVYHDE